MGYLQGHVTFPKRSMGAKVAMTCSGYNTGMAPCLGSSLQKPCSIRMEPQVKSPLRGANLPDKPFSFCQFCRCFVSLSSLFHLYCRHSSPHVFKSASFFLPAGLLWKILASPLEFCSLYLIYGICLPDWTG